MLIIVCRTLVYSDLPFVTKMTSKILIKFGQKVREERLKRGLSQEALAERAGVHRTYVGMIERAEKNITLINIQKIAKALSLEIKDLFTY
jgi:transcriptional regulator with XRE-family HTH domain